MDASARDAPTDGAASGTSRTGRRATSTSDPPRLSGAPPRPGHAEPPTSAQRLLEVGAIGVAVAAAGLRAEPDPAIRSIAVFSADGDDAAQQTADALAAKLGAPIVASDAPAADLIVVGSQAGAPAGRIALGGSTRTMLDASRGSVLVVPSGKPLQL